MENYLTTIYDMLNYCLFRQYFELLLIWTIF